MSGADAKAKIDAGASLVQLYSGLIYAGPALVRDCAARASNNKEAAMQTTLLGIEPPARVESLPRHA